MPLLNYVKFYVDVFDSFHVFSYFLVYLGSMCQYKCVDVSEIEFGARTRFFEA